MLEPHEGDICSPLNHTAFSPRLASSQARIRTHNWLVASKRESTFVDVHGATIEQMPWPLFPHTEPFHTDAHDSSKNADRMKYTDWLLHKDAHTRMGISPSCPCAGGMLRGSYSWAKTIYPCRETLIEVNTTFCAL